MEQTLVPKTAEKKYTVYIHTSPSKKRYVGITCQMLSRRWKNGKGYKSCSGIDAAIKKYGWENISHEIVCAGLTFEEAKKKEIELIDRYKTTEKEHGYNCTRGGDGVNGMKLNAEQLERHRELRRMDWSDPEKRARYVAERRKRGQTPEERERLRQESKKNWSDPQKRKEMRSKTKETFATPEYKALRSEISKKMWESPGYRERWEQSQKAKAEEKGKKISEKLKARWQDDEYRQRQVQAHKKGKQTNETQASFPR